MCWSSGLVADADDCISGPAALPLTLLVAAAATRRMPLLLLMLPLQATLHKDGARWALEARSKDAGEKQWTSRTHMHSKAIARSMLLFSRRSSRALEEEEILRKTQLRKGRGGVSPSGEQ
jgi:hypothetical protein